MSCAYTDKNAAVGLILGTGTNACYFEKIENIASLNGIDKNNNYTYKDATEVKCFYFIQIL